MNIMNKIMHGVVLALFGVACWFVSLILKLPQMAAGNRMAPAFTRFCMEFGPAILVGMAILATGYCVWVWNRKTDNRASWVAFLATTVGALGLVMLPTIVAIYLPLVDALNSLASK
jgi:uncharacterized membrane protein YcjF (UPF0283 family)